MGEKELPLQSKVRNFLSRTNGDFDMYKRHMEPLSVQAKGDVLMLGVEFGVEEIAVIEASIASSQVKSLTLIGSEDSPLLDVVRESYGIPIEVSGMMSGVYFQDNNVLFDTILFINTPSRLIPSDLAEFAEHLNPSGVFYATFNAPDNPSYVPDVPGTSVEIFPDLPANPNYRAVGMYYGVKMTRN